MENNKTPRERADEIYHYGIKKQKWGIRRFQNEDGSLTPAGKARYADDDDNDKGPDLSGKFNRRTWTINGGRDKNSKGSDYHKQEDRMSDFAEERRNTWKDNNSKTNDDIAREAARDKQGSRAADFAEERRNTWKAKDTSDNDSPKEAKADKAKSDDNSGKNNNNSNKSQTEMKTDVKGHKDKSEMTDSELRKYNNRLKAEQEYDKLTAPKDVVGEKLNAGKNVLDASTNIAKTLKTASDDSIRNAPKVKLDLSNMTDAELRNAINRGQLERQYNEMFAPSTVTQGQLSFNEMLGKVTTALTVTGGAVSLAIGIKQLLSK